MDKLQAMKVFVQVVDAGGFTRAADNMQMPKATVSTLISNLESALSIKLLNRTTRHVSVTADGAVYYERCLSILADVHDTEESLSRTNASPSGRLRVDVPVRLGGHLIIPALPLFFKRYPDILLEVGCSDRQVDLIEEGVDCVVRFGQLADSSLIARRVGAIRLVTCAAPSYLASHGRPSHPNDLMQHRCINYFSSKSGKISDWDFAKGKEQIQLKVPGSIAVSDSNAYLTACLAGLGIAQTTSFGLLPYLESGEIELVLQDWCVGAIPLHVVYPQNRHLSAKARVFVEWIADLCAEQPGLQVSARECSMSLAPGQPPKAEPTSPAITRSVQKRRVG